MVGHSGTSWEFFGDTTWPGHSSVPQTCGSAPWHTSWHMSCAWNDSLAEKTNLKKNGHSHGGTTLEVSFMIENHRLHWDVQKTDHFHNFQKQNQTCRWDWLRQLRRDLQNDLAPCRGFHLPWIQFFKCRHVVDATISDLTELGSHPPNFQARP